MHLSDEHALSVLEEVELERAERKETSNKASAAIARDTAGGRARSA